MTDIPVMPDNWWPDEVSVTGRHGDIELCFVVGQIELSTSYANLMDVNLQMLRQAIWNAKHDARPEMDLVK